jgi:hypothetical protein
MLRTLLAAALTVASFGTASAQSTAEHERSTLQTIFAAPALDASLFAANFTSKIPVADVQQFVDSYKSRLGAPTAIERDGYEYAIVSPKGSIRANVAFAQDGKISSLLFHDELSPDNRIALERLLAAQTIQDDWFVPSFTSEVPTAKTQALLADMHAKLGRFVRVDTRKGAYVAVFERGESHAQISADAAGKIDYLAFSKT